MDPDEVLRAKMRALHLLEYMDRTERGLRKKLEKDHPSDVIDETIRYLRSYGYIDDKRYAVRYLSSHLSQKGHRRLFQELYQKGVPSDLVQEAWEELCMEEGSGEDLDERGSIEKLIEKKVKDQTELPRKEYQRLMNFLARRGFSWGDISAVFEEKGIKMV